MPRLLIYDADCPYCASIARLTAFLSAIQIRQHQDESVQELLEATFPEPGFTLFFYTDEMVYWGSAAAEAVADRLGFPQPLTGLVAQGYPYLVRIFSLLSRRSGVRQPSCTCDTCVTNAEGGGLQPLPDDARGTLETVVS